MRSSPQLGKIYYTGDSSGYIMVMGIRNDSVVYSDIFSGEKMMYRIMSKDRFQKDYKPYNPTGLQAKVKARFDHETMRRINKLCASPDIKCS